VQHFCALLVSAADRPACHQLFLAIFLGGIEGARVVNQLRLIVLDHSVLYLTEQEMVITLLFDSGQTALDDADRFSQ
jgi:hypothetical protein